MEADQRDITHSNVKIPVKHDHVFKVLTFNLFFEPQSDTDYMELQETTYSLTRKG